MPRGNPSPELAITVDPEVDAKVLKAAARETRIRRAGLAAVAQWERENGRFTPKEREDARRRVQTQLRAARTVRRPQ
ncbi:MAG: hypothetical protein FJW39_23945 [Acidobacteria bacterium]|nr:hypothetical protein [Acidobacteriota bacterium]